MKAAVALLRPCTGIILLLQMLRNSLRSFRRVLIREDLVNRVNHVRSLACATDHRRVETLDVRSLRVCPELLRLSFFAFGAPRKHFFSRFSGYPFAVALTSLHSLLNTCSAARRLLFP